MWTLPDEAYKALHDWIHAEHGRYSGLMKDEYRILFDPEQPNDIQIAAGSTILISLKITLNHPQFKTTIRRIFTEFPLKEMRRSKALVRAEDATKWYSLSANNLLAKPEKKVSVNSFHVRYITKLQLIDKKTKRSVEVEIQGSAFDAQQRALKLLYGDRLS